MANKNDNVKVPMRWRMKAWWEGYDIDDIKARLNSGGSDEEIEADLKAMGSKSEGDPIGPFGWDGNRLETAQIIWGTGYCGPGGPEYIASMSKLLGMNSNMSVAVIGAGLGGPSRVLAEKFGAWITGYEESKELAAEGMELSKLAGMEGKAAINHYFPDDGQPFERTFDRAYSKEALYTVEDKKKLLANMFEKLKDTGLFLINDYTLNNVEALNDPDVQKWLRQEPIMPYPVPTKTMENLLIECGYILRVNEDISDLYIDMIAKGWAGVDKIIESLVQQDEDKTDTINCLIKEAEFWALRSRVLKKGHMKVWRYLAFKPAEVK